VKSHLRRKTLLFTIIVIISNVLGDFFLSWGLKHRVVFGASALEYVRVLFRPSVALGVGLLIVWLLSRMALLSWADLSFVLPMTSIGYVLNAVMGRAFLAEHVRPGRWAGTVLIMAGTALVGSTAVRTTKPTAPAVPETVPGEELVAAEEVR
jgi:hypothetical protein